MMQHLDENETNILTSSGDESKCHVSRSKGAYSTRAGARLCSCYVRGTTGHPALAAQLVRRVRLNECFVFVSWGRFSTLFSIFARSENEGTENQPRL